MTTEDISERFAEANKDFFNELAPRYDDSPHAIERARIVATRIRKAYAFDETTTTVMEFACGTGLISRELAPYTKRIVGVDISQGMVDQYNLRTFNQGIPKEEMQAYCVELKGKPGELDDEKFDVIVCVAAYHHLTSIEDVTRTLVYFLKPQGGLIVVDLAKHNHGGHTQHNGDHGHDHDHIHSVDAKHIVPHRGGLDEPAVRNAFEGAGLQTFSFEVDAAAKNHTKLFLAIGIKPEA